VIGVAALSPTCREVAGSRVRVRALATTRVGEHDIPCGVVELPDIDPTVTGRRVLVRKRAFSCNYRDRARIVCLATRVTTPACYVVGSELAGVVVAVGPDVTSLRVGDRVIASGSVPMETCDGRVLAGAELAAEGLHPGLPTNHASTELEIVHEYQLVAIPPAMSDVDAAAFSVGAQTAYGLARRARLDRGERALVLAGTSNTSLFLVQALAGRGVAVDVVTTRPHLAPRLAALGADRVLTRDGLAGAAYTAVFDPYFDLHLPWVLDHVAHGGAYYTCGLAEQSPGAAPALSGSAVAGARPPSLRAVVQRAMAGNLALVGHCLGRRADLERALADHAAGRLRVPIDTVVDDGDVPTFFHRTFAAPDRFGKVVYPYAP
jgi:NADPH:quinone reductase-like Zn-dependent oxidoreductase